MIIENTIKRVNSSGAVKSALFDILAVAFIYLVPTFSHLLALPIYYLDPMRIVIILSLVHTRKINAYILAATLPLFSFLVSGHPVFVKSGLMMLELILNVGLYFFLAKRFTNKLAPVVLSIIASKFLYYLGKYLLIKLSLLGMGTFSTPIYMQLIMIVIFSAYVVLLKKDGKKD